MPSQRFPRWQARRMVRRNLALAGDLGSGLTDHDRLAARHLFGILADLEEIAVLAAERGDGIRHQLRDELAHRDTFTALAESLGGKPSTPAEVADLMAYLEGLTGEASLACLNIVAEHWLAGVFEAVATFGLADELFQVIGIEEARHVADALKSARPDPADAVDIVRGLEVHLSRVATCPAFQLPLLTLGGIDGLALIGLRNVSDHWQACAALGVEPGPDIREIEAACRAAMLTSADAPEPVAMNAWQVSRFRLWPDAPALMVAFVDIELRAKVEGCICSTVGPGSTDGPAIDQRPGLTSADLEARVVQALGQVLVQHPELNVTTRAARLWRPKAVEVGVRRLRTRDEVVTIHVRRPHQMDDLVDILARRVERLRAKKYRPLPSIDRELWDLVPPSRCAAVVTNTSDLGADFYLAPLSDLEGSPISVTIGAVSPSGVVRLGVQMDHRAGDGRHLGLIAQGLKDQLTRPTYLETGLATTTNKEGPPTHGPDSQTIPSHHVELPSQSSLGRDRLDAGRRLRRS